MKCCDMASGMLRELILIEEKSRAPDGYGGVTDTWAEYKTVRAHWTGVGGTEKWNYDDNTFMRPATANRYLAVIRFIGDDYGAPALTAEMRVIRRNRTYSMQSVMDMEGKQRWLELMLIEGTPS